MNYLQYVDVYKSAFRDGIVLASCAISWVRINVMIGSKYESIVP